jgi:hypothetical protein
MSERKISGSRSATANSAGVNASQRDERIPRLRAYAAQPNSSPITRPGSMMSTTVSQV